MRVRASDQCKQLGDFLAAVAVEIQTDGGAARRRETIDGARDSLRQLALVEQLGRTGRARGERLRAALTLVEWDVAIDASATDDVERGRDGGAADVARGEVAKAILARAPEANAKLLEQLVEIFLMQPSIVRDAPGKAREAQNERFQLVGDRIARGRHAP